MPCFTFAINDDGDLNLYRGGRQVITFWADEVDDLRRLLNRPTPIHTFGQSIGSKHGHSATAILQASGALILTLSFGKQDQTIFTLPADHVDDLRSELGLMAVRAGEPLAAVFNAADESYGSLEDRTVAIMDRAAAAQRTAEFRAGSLHV